MERKIGKLRTKGIPYNIGSLMLKRSPGAAILVIFLWTLFFPKSKVIIPKASPVPQPPKNIYASNVGSENVAPNVNNALTPPSLKISRLFCCNCNKIGKKAPVVIAAPCRPRNQISDNVKT